MPEAKPSAARRVAWEEPSICSPKRDTTVQAAPRWRNDAQGLIDARGSMPRGPGIWDE